MEWWLNELDVEWRLPLYLLSRQLRTGAYFGRSELFGGVADAFRTDYMYQAGGRLVMDLQGAPLARRVRGDRSGVLLERQVLGLVDRGGDQLRVLAEDPAKPPAGSRVI